MEGLTDTCNEQRRSSLKIEEAMDTLRGHMEGMRDQNAWLLLQLENVYNTINEIKLERQKPNTSGITKKDRSSKKTLCSQMSLSQQHLLAKDVKTRSTIALKSELSALDQVKQMYTTETSRITTNDQYSIMPEKNTVCSQIPISHKELHVNDMETNSTISPRSELSALDQVKQLYTTETRRITTKDQSSMMPEKNTVCSQIPIYHKELHVKDMETNPTISPRSDLSSLDQVKQMYTTETSRITTNDQYSIMPEKNTVCSQIPIFHKELHVKDMETNSTILPRSELSSSDQVKQLYTTETSRITTKDQSSIMPEKNTVCSQIPISHKELHVNDMETNSTISPRSELSALDQVKQLYTTKTRRITTKDQSSMMPEKNTVCSQIPIYHKELHVKDMGTNPTISPRSDLSSSDQVKQLYTTETSRITTKDQSSIMPEKNTVVCSQIPISHQQLNVNDMKTYFTISPRSDFSALDQVKQLYTIVK
ncbi:uncharacterized protein [Argopecten irradians]|uniref:uncharacterized protein n=1 Tax=Argopecten irradians TaxID=31199 RepID=UPI003713363A